MTSPEDMADQIWSTDYRCLGGVSRPIIPQIRKPGKVSEFLSKCVDVVTKFGGFYTYEDYEKDVEKTRGKWQKEADEDKNHPSKWFK